MYYIKGTQPNISEDEIDESIPVIKDAEKENINGN